MTEQDVDEPIAAKADLADTTDTTIVVARTSDGTHTANEVVITRRIAFMRGRS